MGCWGQEADPGSPGEESMDCWDVAGIARELLGYCQSLRIVHSSVSLEGNSKVLRGSRCSIERCVMFYVRTRLSFHLQSSP